MADVAQMRYQGNGQFGTVIGYEKYRDKIDTIPNDYFAHGK
jgi:hypothetical protein